MKHVRWFKKDSTLNLKTIDGKAVTIINFEYDDSDDVAMSEWAKHFRNHYCLDSVIDRLKKPKETRTEYLNRVRFPPRSRRLGPSVRAGDFAEILTADFLEYSCKYWVPRTRYSNKNVSDESPKGVDVIAFAVVEPSFNPREDKLIIVESKTKFSSGVGDESVLQKAINGLNKAHERIDESLNAIKQRFLERGDSDSCDRIERFQDEVENPFVKQYYAVAHFDNHSFSKESVEESDSGSFNISPELILIVFRGSEMMRLVNKLYEIAANEA